MIKNIIQINKKNDRGFTLVEVMIAVGLFSIIMSVALAIILSFIADNKKSQAINSVVTNLNFALDSMVRDIKTGYDYHDGCVLYNNTTIDTCPGAPAGNSERLKGITLISTINRTADKRVHYEFSDHGSITKIVCEKDGSSCVGPSDITSDDVNITDLRFYTDVGASATDYPDRPVQPSVFLIVKGTSAKKDTHGNELTGGAADFTIQTMITQRVLNI